MKIPGADHALVDKAKLIGYSLNLLHPEGRHKANVFANRLGLKTENYQVLERALHEAVRNSSDATLLREDSFGRFYLLDFQMMGLDGLATIRSGWIIRAGEDFPRLTTCYVRRRGA